MLPPSSKISHRNTIQYTIDWNLQEHYEYLSLSESAVQLSSPGVLILHSISNWIELKMELYFVLIRLHLYSLQWNPNIKRRCITPNEFMKRGESLTSVLNFNPQFHIPFIYLNSIHWASLDKDTAKLWMFEVGNYKGRNYKGLLSSILIPIVWWEYNL